MNSLLLIILGLGIGIVCTLCVAVMCALAVDTNKRCDRMRKEDAE